MNIRNILAILLLVSMGLNVWLALYALRESLPAAGQQAREQPAEAMIAVSTNDAPRLPQTSTNTRNPNFGWQTVESADYREYIANLRAVGCPEETIRDIIRADVKKLYEQKRKEVRRAAPRFEYWKGDDFLRRAGREAWMKMLSLNDEEGKVLQALGIEPDISLKGAKNSAAMDWMLDFLDERKKAEIFRLRREAEDKLALRDETVNVEEVLKERDRKLKDILTPDEALHYDLRFSVHARENMGLFDPTEEEYIALFKARKTIAEEAASAPPVGQSAAERQARREAGRRKLQEAIKDALGPDRYADYQMGQDYAYRQIHEITKKAGLGNATAKQVYEMKKAAEAQRARIQAEQSFSEEQRAAALEGIRAETERSIRAVLGKEGWEQFKKGNRWVDESRTASN